MSTNKEDPVMSKRARPRSLLAALFALILAVGLAACGSSSNSSSSGGGGGGKIVSNAANKKVTLTIGSKNFTEQIVLGEIYAQALQAAGYTVKKDLNLRSETVALQALKHSSISGYPQYAATAPTSILKP